MTKIFVECSDEREEEGILAFKELTEHVIKELSLGGVVEEVREYIDLEKPLFFIYVRRKGRRAAEKKISDVAEVKDGDKGEIILDIRDERYAPHILRLLWDNFPEESVSQVGHGMIEIKGVEKKEILWLSVPDPEALHADAFIYDMVFRIVPVGFRIVRRIRMDENTTGYVASENPIGEEEMEEIKSIISREPKELTLTRDELIRKYERPGDGRKSILS